MKTPLFILICLFISISLVSCEKLQTEDKKALKKTVVVLCDLSESTRELKNLYLDSIKKVISSIGHGDVIVVAKITEASIAEADMPIKEVFPEFVAKDNMGNPTDNKFLVNQAKEEADKELSLKKEKIIKDARDLLIDNNVDSHKKIIRTDILSSLHVAEKVFKNYNHNKLILVILSDMIEDSSEYNFEKENLTDMKIEEIIKKEKTKNKIPDIKGVKVYVVAAGSGNSERFFKIQNFWLRYFKECGATLFKENYGSALIQFNE